jgi:N-ethylmaleimide reductase
MNSLFSPLKIGQYTLKNRMVMAPLTRGRAGADGIPTNIMAKYYGQRASSGLVIAEATAITPHGRGWLNSPGLYNQAQQTGWQKVAKAVHDNNGKIFVQIWHMGAAVHPDFIEGQQAVSASAITLNGQLPTPKGRDRVFEQARALTKKEISHQVANFVSAAQRAIDAGLDGVEIHAANGFLIDQFTRDSTNQRDDEYGGSIDNRLRFMMEVVAAVCEKIGSDKVGIRISPTNSTWGISDSEYQATFRRAAQMLNAYQLAYLHVLETQPSQESKMEYLTPSIRQEYQGTLIVNGGYDKNRATNAINKNLADAVSFGMPFIANPDLVERFKEEAPLSQPDSEFFYTEGSRGYSDYPKLGMTTA